MNVSSYSFLTTIFIVCLEIKVNHLKLKDGIRYYGTVSACSIAGLCSSASSDGVLIDSKPPHIAKVIDGQKPYDVDYQSFRLVYISTISDLTLLSYRLYISRNIFNCY